MSYFKPGLMSTIIITIVMYIIKTEIDQSLSWWEVFFCFWLIPSLIVGIHIIKYFVALLVLGLKKILDKIESMVYEE
ncbi:MAG: hypothetical protein ACRDD8_05840 [Bacteroidales bacterium]